MANATVRPDGAVPLTVEPDLGGVTDEATRPLPNALRWAFASLLESSLRIFVVEDDGGARLDGEDEVIKGGGGPCPGPRKDLVASELEEEWCTSCAKDERSYKPKKPWLGATNAGTQGNSPGQVGNGPPP
jgi:hypothetical protein